MDGRIYRSRAFPVHDEQGAYLYSVHSLEDVTVRKAVEDKLQESEAFTKAVLDNLPVGIAVNSMVPPLVFNYMNDNFPEFYGTSRDRLVEPGSFWAAVYEDPGFRRQIRERVEEDCASGDVGRMHWDDIPIERSGEETRFISARNIPLYDRQLMVSMVWDVTERKRHELAMQRANRALRTISAGNQALIHATEEMELLHQMCEVAVQVGGYHMAWIGYARDDAGKTIDQMAHSHSGAGHGCPDLVAMTWDEAKQDSCPAGIAIARGETRVVQDILAESGTNPWREHALEYGCASCIALPLMEKERAFGVLVLLDDKVNVFDGDEVGLLEEMSGDLAFGILTLRVREAHREHEQRLQKNMLQTVEAIAGMVEMRDPYTSGHQARVAELARAIAREMGLTEEESEVIHLAGLVHDLGKIRIPAEILSKPGRLNEFEYGMIKTHPQAGYDILKGIDFSWPIAQMVLQHHERLDGSGYPRGLKGEEILLGARILSVADVVEAMASHRPYRPGLGGGAALDEIVRQRGVHYDAKVVDACLALFREQGYRLPE